MVWKPNVTVAAVLEKDGALLFVREKDHERTVINQPAGHLEDGETLLTAVEREVLEETGWRFTPQYLIGVYQLRMPEKEITYLRFCFGGDLVEQTDHPIDEDILETVWLTPSELQKYDGQLRSPLVTQCVDDFLAGQSHPLSLIRSYT